MGEPIPTVYDPDDHRATVFHLIKHTVISIKKTELLLCGHIQSTHVIAYIVYFAAPLRLMET